ncbi:hypothetical protein E2C01_024372 [Portunus trituberculatus]|uniref:Uncharacterized protein n=1 Tax=Portunus trituberculatus TaxID=210409 RepID=A0A5B7ECI8_PORTR|nr:hypothetical protein [Portunus trituberculatus]
MLWGGIGAGEEGMGECKGCRGERKREWGGEGVGFGGGDCTDATSSETYCAQKFLYTPEGGGCSRQVEDKPVHEAETSISHCNGRCGEAGEALVKGNFIKTFPNELVPEDVFLLTPERGRPEAEAGRRRSSIPTRLLNTPTLFPVKTANHTVSSQAALTQERRLFLRCNLRVRSYVRQNEQRPSLKTATILFSKAPRAGFISSLMQMWNI